MEGKTVGGRQVSGLGCLAMHVTTTRLSVLCCEVLFATPPASVLACLAQSVHVVDGGTPRRRTGVLDVRCRKMVDKTSPGVVGCGHGSDQRPTIDHGDNRSS